MRLPTMAHFAVAVFQFRKFWMAGLTVKPLAFGVKWHICQVSLLQLAWFIWDLWKCKSISRRDIAPLVTDNFCFTWWFLVVVLPKWRSRLKSTSETWKQNAWQCKSNLLDICCPFCFNFLTVCFVNGKATIKYNVFLVGHFMFILLKGVVRCSVMCQCWITMSLRWCTQGRDMERMPNMLQEEWWWCGGIKQVIEGLQVSRDSLRTQRLDKRFTKKPKLHASSSTINNKFKKAYESWNHVQTKWND